MHHALVLRDDHGVAYVVVAIVFFQCVGFRLGHKPFHPFAVFTRGRNTVGVANLGNLFHAVADAVRSGDQGFGKLFILGGTAQGDDHIQRLFVRAVQVLELVMVHVFKAVHRHIDLLCDVICIPCPTRRCANAFHAVCVRGGFARAFICTLKSHLFRPKFYRPQSRKRGTKFNSDGWVFNNRNVTKKEKLNAWNFLPHRPDRGRSRRSQPHRLTKGAHHD